MELETWFVNHNDDDRNWFENRKNYQEYANILLNHKTEEHAGTTRKTNSSGGLRKHEGRHLRVLPGHESNVW